MANEKEKIQLSEPAPAMASPMQQRPSLPWRAGSSVIMGLTGMLSRGFLYGLNTVEATGLQNFLKVLDDREDVQKRTKGLLTGTVPAPRRSAMCVCPLHVLTNIFQSYSLQPCQCVGYPRTWSFPGQASTAHHRMKKES